MASLYILKKIYKELPPNTFIPTITNADVMISGISKFAIEHTLLNIEMSIYNGLFIMPLFVPTIVKTHPETIIPLVLSLLIIYPVIYGIPAYRTYKSFVNKNLQIIDFKKKIN